jgi:dTDP-4-dehydrorhamnose 3,5-epimerase
MGTINDITLTQLKIIPAGSGEVMHALKNSETSFHGFGEAYFSTVNNHTIKGWKKHLRMISNLIVPSGKIRFILYDDRPGSASFKVLQEVVLSLENYQRLTVPPGIWMAFQGQSDNTNMLLNISSIPHDPSETESLPLKNDIIPFAEFE